MQEMSSCISQGKKPLKIKFPEMSLSIQAGTADSCRFAWNAFLADKWTDTGNLKKNITPSLDQYLDHHSGAVVRAVTLQQVGFGFS